ncbi:MAG TPA: hypothetical protein VN706_25210 [Gemmatimonadaceae bacterium]|nr:hypothetical protein [Gemmatimonadaceae bacterium]
MHSATTPTSILAAALLSAAALIIPPRNTPPCYTTLIAVVAQPPSHIIRRIATTGTRRFDDAGSGTRAHCTPSDTTARSTLFRLLTQQLGTADSASTTWVDIASTDSQIVRGVLPRILAAVPTHATTFTFVELVYANTPGSLDPAPPRLARADSTYARCLADNADLERRNAAFRYAC